MDEALPLFLFIYIFSLQLTVNSNVKFADDWIRTAVPGLVVKEDS